MASPAVAASPATSANDQAKPFFMKPRFYRSLITLLVLVLAWELSGRFLFTNRLFFVPLSSVMEALYNLAVSGELWKHFSASATALLYGMVIATVIGVAVGVLLGASRTASDYLEVYLNALYSTPLVAIAPLFILWLGIGVASKVAVVFLISVFPIIISTAAGIRNVDANYIDVAKAFNTSKRNVIRKIMLPAALPFVITGIRLAVGRAVVGVVIGELFGSNAGFGFLILNAGQTFNVPVLFASVICLAAIGVTLTWAVQAVEVRVTHGKRAVLED